MPEGETNEVLADVIGGFPVTDPNCAGCGKPLTLENAWMTDGCPCNHPLGINNQNETRWRLLMRLQQLQDVERNKLSEKCEQAAIGRSLCERTISEQAATIARLENDNERLKKDVEYWRERTTEKVIEKIGETRELSEQLIAASQQATLATERADEAERMRDKYSAALTVANATSVRRRERLASAEALAGAGEEICERLDVSITVDTTGFVAERAMAKVKKFRAALSTFRSATSKPKGE